MLARDYDIVLYTEHARVDKWGFDFAKVTRISLETGGNIMSESSQLSTCDNFVNENMKHFCQHIHD